MAPIGDDSTIVALATARGVAALAMIRISGPEAVRIAAACFRPFDLTESTSHRAHVGFIQTADGQDVDQVVATVFLAPHSVTGEEVVEISCHGGDYASNLVMKVLLTAGARPAGPGEFTERAFLNGKIDLAQAEAVADIIHAGSKKAHETSLVQLKGAYSELLESLRQEMLDLCAFVELELDFSEEDVAFADRNRLEALLEEGSLLLSRLLESYRFGSVVRDGVRVVIGGRPNAGKSTLLNALVGFDRAIVSEIPGTTRDEIEAEVEYEGLRFRFLDTAGLRDTHDAIEAEGVRRAESSIRQADALLYVFDVTIGLDAGEQDFLNNLSGTHPNLYVAVIGNKADMLAENPSVAHMTDSSPTDGRSGASLAARAPASPLPADFILSARDGLKDESIVEPVLLAVTGAIRGDEQFAEGSVIVTNERHRAHLEAAHRAVGAAGESLAAGVTGDLLAIELRTALQELGAITGAITNEDVLGRIFSRFCIGK